MPTFAEQLNTVRKERQITQEQLAKDLNISRTTISRWESGKALPDIETIKQLSQVLNHNFFAVVGLDEASLPPFPAQPVNRAEPPAEAEESPAETPVPPTEPAAEEAAPTVETPEPPAETPASPAEKAKRLAQHILVLLRKVDQRVWWLAGGALGMLLIMLLLMPLFRKAPAVEATAMVTATPVATATEAPTATPTEVPTATPTAVPTATPTEAPTNVPTATPALLPSAEIVVTTSVEEAYLIPFGDQGGYGWDVSFYFGNVSDVPFTPERIIANYYEDDRLAASIVLTYADLRPWMHNDKLIKGNDPLHWPFGSNQLYLTHMEAIIIGTDDNGNRIEASATVRYVNEYASAQNQP